MYTDFENKNQNISAKTNYIKRNRYKLKKQNNNNNKYNYHYNNYQIYYKSPLNEKRAWAKMLARASKKGQNKNISNSKIYQNTLMPMQNYNNNFEDKKLYKDKELYNDKSYLNKIPIKTLPDNIQRNKYKNGDKYIYFQKPYNYSKLFKSIYDYNSNISYEKNYDPITQGYNVNSFPTKQRYYGSYKLWVKDHDIFNTRYLNKKKSIYDYYD